MALSFAVGLMMGNGSETVSLGMENDVMRSHPVPKYNDMNNISDSGGSISAGSIDRSGFTINGSGNLSQNLDRGKCCVFYCYKKSNGEWTWAGGFLDWMRADTSESFRNKRDWNNWPGLGPKVVSEFKKTNGNVNGIKVCVLAEDHSIRSTWANFNK